MNSTLLIAKVSLCRWVYQLLGFTTLLFISFGAPISSYGAPSGKYYDLPKVVAVQNRSYYVNKDLTFQLGFLPSDPFNKGVTFGVGYTHYFKDYLAWEVANVNYNMNRETGLKRDVNNLNIDIQNKGGLSGQLDYMNYYLATNLVYTPIYAKNLLFNSKVIHGEISLTLGGGVTKLQKTGVRPLVMAGGYFRFFTQPDRSWKFDFRNNIYFSQAAGAINAWSFGIGYSIQLGDRPPSVSSY